MMQKAAVLKLKVQYCSDNLDCPSLIPKLATEEIGFGGCHIVPPILVIPRMHAVPY